LKEKKEISKWGYILCMIGVVEKKCLGVFVDGAWFQLPLE
jgi:hypothetical protein